VLAFVNDSITEGLALAPNAGTPAFRGTEFVAASERRLSTEGMPGIEAKFVAGAVNGTALIPASVAA
jgi:hypothetical protein